MNAFNELTLRPIGVVHSPFWQRREAPRQSALCEDIHGTIELYPGNHFEQALIDIDTWSHIWVLFWFHVNDNWRPMVQPPRGMQRRGVFATRSPHRPNPLGLSAVKLERRRGLILEVSALDILDGTPVFDLKPYVPYTDVIPSANGGWPEQVAPPTFDVVFTPRALRHLLFLGELGANMKAELERVLSLGPKQPKYRRIRRLERGFQIAVEEWRVLFDAADAVITVTGVQSGYRAVDLETNPATELDVHRAFSAFATADSGPTSE
jgi:tRNA (adenine37-N6)-methyltransferase